MNFLITPVDGVLTEITNDAIGLAEQGRSIDLVANLYFGIASAIFVTIVVTFITAKFVEGRLGTYGPSLAGTGPEDADQPAGDEARGLRMALWATLGIVLVITLLTVIPGAPLRAILTEFVQRAVIAPGERTRQT